MISYLHVSNIAWARFVVKLAHMSIPNCMIPKHFEQRFLLTLTFEIQNLFASNAKPIKLK